MLMLRDKQLPKDKTPLKVSDDQKDPTRQEDSKHGKKRQMNGEISK